MKQKIRLIFILAAAFWTVLCFRTYVFTSNEYNTRIKEPWKSIVNDYNDEMQYLQKMDKFIWSTMEMRNSGKMDYKVSLDGDPDLEQQLVFIAQIIESYSQRLLILERSTGQTNGNTDDIFKIQLLLRNEVISLNKTLPKALRKGYVEATCPMLPGGSLYMLTVTISLALMLGSLFPQALLKIPALFQHTIKRTHKIQSSHQTSN